MKGKEDLDILYNKLKEKGVRITPQRKVILDLLKNTSDHLTAEEIYQKVKQKLQRVSLGTVYNTLHKLKETGIIQELSYGDMSSRYDGSPNPHYHVTCVECGRVVDFYRDLVKSLEEEAEESTKYKVNAHRIEFYGICTECQNSVAELVAGQ